MEYEYEKGVKNIITAYFKRGLMSNEQFGKNMRNQIKFS